MNQGAVYNVIEDQNRDFLLYLVIYKIKIYKDIIPADDPVKIYYLEYIFEHDQEECNFPLVEHLATTELETKTAETAETTTSQPSSSPSTLTIDCDLLKPPILQSQIRPKLEDIFLQQTQKYNLVYRGFDEIAPESREKFLVFEIQEQQQQQKTNTVGGNTNNSNKNDNSDSNINNELGKQSIINSVIQSITKSANDVFSFPTSSPAAETNNNKYINGYVDEIMNTRQIGQWILNSNVAFNFFVRNRRLSLFLQDDLNIPRVYFSNSSSNNNIIRQTTIVGNLFVMNRFFSQQNQRRVLLFESLLKINYTYVLTIAEAEAAEKETTKMAETKSSAFLFHDDSGELAIAVTSLDFFVETPLFGSSISDISPF